MIMLWGIRMLPMLMCLKISVTTTGRLSVKSLQLESHRPRR